MYDREFREAYVNGFVLGLTEREFECILECDECPMATACDTLSEQGHYDAFIANYKLLDLASTFSKIIEGVDNAKL